MTPRPVHLLLVLALLAGCAKNGNNASVQMTALCAPPDGACKFGNTCPSVVERMEVDLDVIQKLPGMPIEVHNLMENNANPDTEHTNTNDALVQHAEISYDVPGFAVGSITTDLVKIVYAGNTTVVMPSFMNSQSIAEFSTALGAGGAAEAIVNVKLKGTIGDAPFETGSFPVPVYVCRGCLATKQYTCESADQVPKEFCLQRGQEPVTFTCGTAPKFSIGGAVNGLTTDGLVVHCGSTDITAVSGATSWSLAGLTDGSPYTCLISTQPTGQTCVFADPSKQSGTVSGANVTDIDINCS